MNVKPLFNFLLNWEISQSIESFLSHSGLLNGKETQTPSVFTLQLMRKWFSANGNASTQPGLGHGTPELQWEISQWYWVLAVQCCQDHGSRDPSQRRNVCTKSIAIPAKEGADLDLKLNYICPAQISGKCSKNEQVWQWREELGCTGVPVLA